MGVLWKLAARALIQSPVEVAEQRCSRSRLNGSDCRRCVEVCPSEAITLEEVGLRVDALACDGCGLCQGACWSSAFSLRDLTLPAPLGAGDEEGGRGGPDQPPAALQPLRLTCGGHVPAGANRGSSAVPCLGSLDPGRLAELAAGRSLTLAPVIPCAECQWAKGEALARENLAVVMRVLANYGIPGEVEWEEAAPAASAGMSETEARSVAPLADGTAEDGIAEPAPGDRILGRREWLESLGGGVRRTLGRALAEALPGESGTDLPDVGQRLRRLAAAWERRA